MLDVCTGHGVLALAATKRGANVFAIDFAEAMVAAARRNVPAAECRQERRAGPAIRGQYV